MKLGWKATVVSLPFVVLPVTSYCETQAEQRPHLLAIRVETPPEIDGRLDEAVWKRAPAGTHFIQKQPEKGLPEPPTGKIAVAVAPTNSNRVYALIEIDDKKDTDGVLWRSDDGGESWELINREHMLASRPLYYTRLAVSTNDHNELYTVADSYCVSHDGGQSFKKIPREKSPGGDNHEIWVDPLIPDRIVVGNDNPGISISMNRGETWDKIRLPIAQMYHGYVDNQIPYYVYGNRQDGPSTRGPSNSLSNAGIPSGMWRAVGGGESGFAVPDPVDNTIVWSGNNDGQLDIFDGVSLHSRSVTVWPEDIDCWAAKDVKYRFNWTFPICISPHDHNKVYVGSQFVHQTTNGGHSWTEISPDLTTNDKSQQELTGGLTRDDAVPTYGNVLFAIAESPLEEGLIWAGTNDGVVQVTRDGGVNWSNVTGNIPELPPLGTVSNIEPSRYDGGTCYITVDLHQVNNRDPYAYKTTDYGKTWKRISSDIPRSELSYAHCIREDPKRKGLLYLGTENAIYVSFDDGAKWHSLQTNLPPAPVHWLTIQEHFNDLVVATYGRGFWILDDLTAIQQITPEALSSDVHLFTLRPAYRFLSVATPMSDPRDQSVGENPPYGASINYYLKSEPEDEVVITILDEQDQVVRTLSSEKTEEDEQGESRDRATEKAKVTKSPGINRVWWDLRYEQTKEVKLRTSPIGAPHVRLGDKGWRDLPRRVSRSVLVAPGTYTVRLEVNDNEMTQMLTVIRDPNSKGTEADILAQTKRALEIRDNMNAVVDMINQIEMVRKQIYDLKSILRSDKEDEKEADSDESGDPVITAAEELDNKLIELEDNFFSTGLTGSDDGLRWEYKFLSRLNKLARDMSKADYPPTTQQVEAHEKMKNDLAGYGERYRELMDKDLADFHNLLSENDVTNIMVGSR